MTDEPIKFILKTAKKMQDNALETGKNVSVFEAKRKYWNYYRPRFEDKQYNQLLQKVVVFDYLSNRDMHYVDVIKLLNDSRIEEVNILSADLIDKSDFEKKSEVDKKIALTMKNVNQVEEGLITYLGNEDERNFFNSNLDKFYLEEKSDFLLQYKVIEFFDNDYGSLNIEDVETELTKLSQLGWEVISSITNELGKNSTGSSVGINGIGIGASTNYTSEQTVIILQRKVPRTFIERYENEILKSGLEWQK